MKEVYKIFYVEFFGEKARAIRIDNQLWISCKDVFAWLGRVKADGTWTHEKNKMLAYLKNIKKEVDHQSLVVEFKEGSGGIQEIDFIKVERLPLIITKFEPTARASEEKHNKWCELMIFIDDLLEKEKVHNFFIKDKEHHKEKEAPRIQELYDSVEGHKPDNVVKAHQQIHYSANKLTAEHFGHKYLNKEELRALPGEQGAEELAFRQIVMELLLNSIELNNGFTAYETLTRSALNRRFK